jgi:hypothetical protein
VEVAEELVQEGKVAVAEVHIQAAHLTLVKVLILSQLVLVGFQAQEDHQALAHL